MTHRPDIFRDIPGIWHGVSYTRYISKYVWDISSESFCPSRMSGICQGYSRHIFSESFGNMSGICQGYTRHMVSESFRNMSGIYPTYSFACEPPCSSNAIGRLLCLRHRDCECHHGCLMISSKRGRHVEHWRCQDWSMSCTSMPVTPSCSCQ